MELMGMISAIQRTSIHDGPGIRTTVFLKGCNMRCAWCHNPETVSFESEYIFNKNKCINCGYCEEGCYTGARTLCGKPMSVDMVMQEILQDKPYYDKEGGVTISGGEPTMQLNFVLELLRKVKSENIHVGIETNMSLPFEKIEKLIPFVDLWMIDLKANNTEIHKKYTGLDNSIIKKNIMLLDKENVKIIVRTPIIPAVNFFKNEIIDILMFVSNIVHLEYYEVLPYHKLGLSKELSEQSFIKYFDTLNKKDLMDLMIEISENINIPIRVANVVIKKAE